MVACVLLFSIIFTILAVHGVDFKDLQTRIYFSEEPNTRFKVGITRFLQLVIITSYFLPISLVVNMELTRFFQTFMIESDKNCRIPAVREYIDKHGYKSLKSSPEFSNMAPP